MQSNTNLSFVFKHNMCKPINFKNKLKFCFYLYVMRPVDKSWYAVATFPHGSF